MNINSCKGTMRENVSKIWITICLRGLRVNWAYCEFNICYGEYEGWIQYSININFLSGLWEINSVKCEYKRFTWTMGDKFSKIWI